MSTDVWVELRRNYGRTESLLPLIQAKIFEESVNRGLDSGSFMEAYMTSEVAALIDHPNCGGLLSGKRYLLGQVLREREVPGGHTWGEDSLFNIGFTYRLWALLTRQTSMEIYRIADCGQMYRLYFKRHFECPESLIVDALEARNLHVSEFVPAKN